MTRIRSRMTWLTALLQRPPIGWWDLLDILVVSIIIYEVLKLIRGTRAVQMAIGAGVFVGAVLRVALVAARDRQLADSEPRRLPRVRDHRAVPVRHPARARAPRARAVLPLSREGGIGRGIDRGARRRRQHAAGAARRRDHRDRAADRAAQLHRGRHSARRRADLRPAASASFSPRRRCTTAR